MVASEDTSGVQSIAVEFVSSEAPEEVEIVRVFGRALANANLDALVEDEDEAGERFGIDGSLLSHIAVVLLTVAGQEALAAGKKITYGLLHDLLKRERSKLKRLETRLHGKCTVLPKLEAFVKSRAKA